jgi:hypothetical protein
VATTGSLASRDNQAQPGMRATEGIEGRQANQQTMSFSKQKYNSGRPGDAGGDGEPGKDAKFANEFIPTQ